MKEYQFRINGETYNVAIEEKDANLAEVQVNGKTLTVEMETKSVAKRSRSTTAPKTQPAATPVAERSDVVNLSNRRNTNSVKSPLPGTISRIAVSQGQPVEKGALLLTMEAMKMENNILAPRAGAVKTIHVQTGQTVLPGDALVDLE